jgi:hypothetical protein
MTRRSLTYKGYNYVLFLELCHSSSPALEQVEQHMNVPRVGKMWLASMGFSKGN